MKADIECHGCCVRKAEGLLEQYQVPDEKKEQVMEAVLETVKGAGAEESAPVMMARVMRILESEVGITDAYDIPKQRYNELLLSKEDGICQEIRQEKDPFFAALQYAITGNYIDFGAMADANEEKLNELLADRHSVTLDAEETALLRKELACAKKLVYITDNAGEIVLDKVFIRVIEEIFPELDITVLVRGVPTLNDATVEDAEFAGVDQLARILPNGTDIPGTPLEEISQEALKAIDEADLCIAKGQGNFETLRGCGRNIYYLFLCKCQLFVKKFQVERFTPVLSNETRIVQYA